MIVMKLIALNGSPRRAGNTAVLLKEALAGAASGGAEISFVDLYSLEYKGCISCFACKRKGLAKGFCYVQDGLTPVLAEVRRADAVIFGSPIYHMNLTSGLQAFLERFLFPTNIYSTEIPSVLGKKMPSAFFYTMNVTEKQAEKVHLQDSLQPYEDFTSKALGLVPHRLCAYNTLQFDDYTKYESAKFSEADKRAYQEKYGPVCLKQAFDLGAALVKEAEALTQTC